MARAIGPATRCDAVHSRWDVPTLLRYIKIACDVLRCIFQHVAPDFGISQLFIVRFSNDFQHDNQHLMSFLICDSDWPHCCDFSGETCICDVLPWSAMLLEAQYGRKMAHFIASCGRALWFYTILSIYQHTDMDTRLYSIRRFLSSMSR